MSARANAVILEVAHKFLNLMRKWNKARRGSFGPEVRNRRAGSIRSCATGASVITWRAGERELNALPQFIVPIDGGGRRHIASLFRGAPEPRIDVAWRSIQNPSTRTWCAERFFGIVVGPNPSSMRRYPTILP